MIKYSNDQLITDDELKYIDSLSNNVLKVNKCDRRYSVYTLNEHDKNIFLKKILKWIEATGQVQLHRYDSDLYDCYLITYHKDDFFSKHKDNTYLKNGFMRRFVAGFHLYCDYTGGDFILYDDIKKTNILNKPGVTYLFDGDIEHEVLPIETGIRKSIIMFINEEHLISNKLKSII
jgi:hypothetical protein